MADSADPRVFFSAERTLLAWIRTGIAIIGLGFVVARFGLFLRMMAKSPDAAPSTGSSIIGIGFTLLGATCVGAAAWQHNKFIKGLSPAERPNNYSAVFSLLTAVGISISAVILAIHLALGTSMMNQN